MNIVALPYEIAHCSSWDDGYSPEQLVSSSPGNRSSSVMSQSELADDDDSYDGKKIKGWQTPKCPNYPQDLIIHLLCGPAHISKVQILSHHYKIATKIDVYIGMSKQDIATNEPIVGEDDDTLIEFTRLGYVCLDNNMRAQFRARELKSIKVNTDGEYIRLVLRNCHRNKLNLYNQVGLIALNVLGQPIHYANKIPIVEPSQHPLDDMSLLSSSTRRTSVSSDHSFQNRSAAITQYGGDDDIQQWIGVLQQAEKEAVQYEAYQQAKSYSYLTNILSNISKKLLHLEFQKQEAIEIKDYDRADDLKNEISDTKEKAYACMKDAGIQITRDGKIMTLQEAYDYEDEAEQPVEQPIYQETECGLYDDKSCLQNEQKDVDYEEPTAMSNTQQSYGYHLSKSPSLVEQRLSLSFADQSDLVRPIASLSTTVAKKHELSRKMSVPRDPDSIPEPLMDEERQNCRTAIDVFGEDTVACILSVRVKCRQLGLTRIATDVAEATHLAQEGQLEQFVSLVDIVEDSDSDMIDSDDEDALSATDDIKRAGKFVRAALILIQETVMDSREHILSTALSIWQDLNDFSILVSIPPGMIFAWIERAFSCLLMRTNDSNVRVREQASEFVILLGQQYCYAPYSLLDMFIGKPERIIHNHKDAMNRIALVEFAVNRIQIATSENADASIELDNLMQFVLPYLSHSHESVREAAVGLVVSISDQVGFKNVSTYIDEDLRKSLTETVKKFAQSRNENDQSNQTIDITSEIRAAVAKTEPRTINKKTKAATQLTSKGSDEELTKKKTATAGKKLTSSKNREKATPTKKVTSSGRTASRTTTRKSGRAKETSNNDTTCIFCDKTDPAFNEETLISHYYNDCPMLTNCPMCQIILEVSTLSDHLLGDCEKRNLLKQCGRCKNAIPIEQWLQHSSKQTCIAAVENEVRCPHCHKLIETASETGWKTHLLHESCPKNPRTIKKKSTKNGPSSNKPSTMSKRNETTPRKKKL
ncbi:uncharacterized protein BYT42DRAFT_564515 [Radiomyces spectabilis]|uniref:uncharacterized protein n=1 Tax=Radiomyces spectabilis TaxID=64574 RepID=UPI0022209917|nr:uncharacterized protein BYT42DRAFT_564515 [Radiomyces spectabilis]KAI8385053.1 hypothetical protein BYT42DRAFT_564515 [Radiomyces spectabilis]